MAYVGLPPSTPDAMRVDGVPLLNVRWCVSRSAIQPGEVPADGQLLPRALYPDAAAAVIAGMAPTVSDATWQSTPIERGRYTLGDGSTTFRVPDYNGKSAGSLGALFQRGDGALSAAVAGAIQTDAFQGHFHDITSSHAGQDGAAGSAINGIDSSDGTIINVNKVVGAKSDGVNGTPRTAAETRPLNVTGCWVIKLYGVVTNVGAANAAELATAYGAMATRITAAEADLAIFEQKLLSGNGYQKMKGGLIIQWGGTSSASNTFPIAFPTACLRIVAEVMDWNAATATASQYTCVTSRSASGFTLAAASSPRTLEWIAIGY